MIAVIDWRTPPEAVQELKKYVSEIFLFKTENTTIESISGHPDIFIFKHNDKIILSPETPNNLIKVFVERNIKFIFGHTNTSVSIKSSVAYNCVVTENNIFHKNNFTDKVILSNFSDKKFINLPQAFTACSLIAFDNNNFITSDSGIYKTLNNIGLNCKYFNPEKIKIYGHKYGFIGGTSGIKDNNIFFTGNINKYPEKYVIEELAVKSGKNIVCLSDNFLYDGGRIFFI